MGYSLGHNNLEWGKYAHAHCLLMLTLVRPNCEIFTGEKK